jgi:hypothetical protein
LSQTAIVKAIYDRFCKPLLKQLEDPVGSQEKCLRRVLNRAKDTVYGKQHGFQDIRSIEEFQRVVPINSYESLQPYISRTMAGEQNVLFPDKILCFLVTSGTTGDPKLFPFGEQRVQDTIINVLRSGAFYVVHHDRWDTLDGYRLVFPAPSSLGQKIGEYEVAFMSGALTVAPLPPQLKMFQTSERRRVPPLEVDNILDWEEKFYLTARYAVSADVRSATGITSNIVSLLRKISTDYLDQLLADSEVGSTTKTKLREASSDGVIDLQKIWPDFRVLLHGGVSITPFRRAIQDLVGDIDLWEGYAATEGWLATQVYLDKGMMPYVGTMFFEFISEDDEDAMPIPLSDVKAGKPYRVLVTNAGGFYRYDIGDIIVFTGTDPLTMRVIGRKASIVSLAGERMSEELILRAIDWVCRDFGIGFVDFALLPEVSAEVIRYHLFIEFTQTPDNLEEFTSQVDARLGLVNIMYGAQRQANVIHLPVIIPVQPGGFETMLKGQEKILGQTKVPRLLTPELSRLIPRLSAST